MRVTVGIDLVTVGRLARLVEEPSALAAIFTEPELAYCRGTRGEHERLAARFAAKEAVLKALGTGLSGDVALNEVEITKSPSGRPGVQLLGATRAQAERSGVVDVQVSMSHSGGVAVANALAVWRPLEDS